MMKVTIYTKGGMGFVNSLEGWLEDHGRRQYAQYADAVFVKYRAKRRRKSTGLIQGYRPWVLIVEGWNKPDLEDVIFDTEVKEDGTVIKSSKFTACSDENLVASDKKLDSLIEQGTLKVVADYRSVKVSNNV